MGPVALCLAVLTAGSGVATARGSASAVAPTFVQSIGQAAHPAMAPSGLAVDPQGNLYIADTGNSQVAAYNAQGTQLWRVGQRGSTANGNFLNPRDVAYAKGLLYVADTGNNRIQVLSAATGAWQSTFPYRFAAVMGVGVGSSGGQPIILAADSTQNVIDTFTPSGTLLLKVGSAGSGNGQLNQARDATAGGLGTIYVADYKNQRVEVFDSSGHFLRAWGTHCPYTGACTQPGEFQDPYGIVLDAAGYVYVSDNYRIQKFTATGTFVAQFGQGCPKGGCTPNELFQLRRVAVGPGSSPNVYAADLWGDKVVEYNQAGAIVQIFGNVPPATGGFDTPFGLTLSGSVLSVTDTNNQRIEEFNATTGAFEAAWGVRGYGSNLDGVNWPRDIAYNATTNTFWLADTKNYRLTEHDLNGTATGRVIGSAGTVLQPAILNWTFGVASWQGDVIAADTFNNRVEEWSGSSATTPVWTATGMNRPEAVTVAGDDVWVADTSNARLVELNATTGATLSTISGGLFGRPDGIAVDPKGNLWVADAQLNQLIELSTAGTLIQTVGSFGTGSGQFNGPAQLAIGPGSTPNTTWLYATDANNDRIQVFDITNS